MLLPDQSNPTSKTTTRTNKTNRLIWAHHIWWHQVHQQHYRHQNELYNSFNNALLFRKITLIGQIKAGCMIWLVLCCVFYFLFVLACQSCCYLFYGWVPYLLLLDQSSVDVGQRNLQPLEDLIFCGIFSLFLVESLDSWKGMGCGLAHDRGYWFNSLYQIPSVS